MTTLQDTVDLSVYAAYEAFTLGDFDAAFHDGGYVTTRDDNGNEITPSSVYAAYVDGLLDGLDGRMDPDDDDEASIDTWIHRAQLNGGPWWVTR